MGKQTRLFRWFILATMSSMLFVTTVHALTPGSGWQERTVNNGDISQNAVAVVSGYDIDGDGNGEFVALLEEGGASNADDVVIFEATSDNTYSKVWGVDFDADTGDGASRGLYVGDSDGDGEVEIIVGQMDPDQILIYEYAGSGQITDGSNPSETPTTSLSTASTIKGIIVADLDSDTNNEIIAVTIDGSEGLYLFESTGNNSYASAITANVGNAGASGLAGADVDLDGDGTREIAVTGEDDRLHVYEFDGTGFSDEGPSVDLGDEGTPKPNNYALVYDLDQSGLLEIVVSNRQDDEIYVFESTAADTYGRDASDEVIDNGTEPINSILAGNLVGDSRGEIYYEDNSGAIRYREFTGSAGSFTASDFGGEQTLTTGGGSVFNGIGYGNGVDFGNLGSLDGDSNRDIVLVRNSDGSGADSTNEIYVLESETSKPTAILLGSLTATSKVQSIMWPIVLFVVVAILLSLDVLQHRRLS